ncbi:MAG: hypothetical protein ACREP9_01725, partial [Candidatus Dormibacteraceae bacterium]
LNPAAALPIHKNNYEAVINALVQYFHGGDSTLNNPPAPLIKWIMLRCDQPQTRLESRISQVLDEQYRHGLIEEVHWLNHHYDLHNEMRRRGQRSSNQVLHTHGYREFFELAGERSRGVESLGKADLQRVREQTLEHIVRYSRHQRSWFNKFPGTRITGLEDAYRVVGRAIDKFGPFKMHS